MRSDWSRDRFKTLDNWTGQDFCNAPSNDENVEIRAWRHIQNQEERLERLQLAWKEAAIASYERALKDKSFSNTAKSSPKYPSNNTLSIMSSSPLCCHASAMSHCHVLTLSTVIVRCPPAVSLSLFFSRCPSRFVLLPLSSLCALYTSWSKIMFWYRIAPYIKKRYGTFKEMFERFKSFLKSIMSFYPSL